MMLNIRRLSVPRPLAPKARRAFRSILAAGLLAGFLAPTAWAQAEAPATPENGKTEERFGNWILRCMTEAADATRRCEMVQMLGDDKTGQDVLLVAIGYPEGQTRPVAWIILPLGVLLPPGIGLKIDQSEPKGLPFRHCDRGGCATPWPLSETDIAALKQGSELVVIFKDIEGQSLGLPVSLSGFTAAFSRLQ